MRRFDSNIARYVNRLRKNPECQLLRWCVMIILLIR